MGWLRDYMQVADPPIPSFGRLADMGLAHEAWPNDTRPQPRSLATLFSKLDRGQQLDWLRDRLAVQQVLSDLLGRPLSDLRTSIGEVPVESSDRFLRLDDIRYAREVDLSREPLPPGIPPQVCDPTSWSTSWWIAVPGAGKGITASWLRCRGLAHCATIACRNDLERLPTRGSLYLELLPSLFNDGPALSRADLERLRAHARPILLAAGEAPPPDLQAEIIHSPPVDEILPELVDWVQAHLDEGGHFNPDRAEQWIRRVALRAFAAQTLGDTLGLLGMMDELDPRSLLAKSLDEVGRHFVARRVREASEAATASPRLAQEAYDALLDCAGKCLLSNQYSLTMAHGLDTWTQLLSPQQGEDPPDPEWFTAALSGALGHQVSRRDLKRAAKKLRPSAFALARSLLDAHLLVRPPFSSPREREGELRRLRPQWLTSLLHARAATIVLDYSCSQWGQALLHSNEADRVLSALIDRATDGNLSIFFNLLEDFDADSPFDLAALEGATIAVGICLLDGVELPSDLIEQLLEENAQTAMVVDSEMLPRTTRSIERSVLFTDHLYSCAIVALCDKARHPLPHLDPMRSNNPKLSGSYLRRVLEQAKMSASLDANDGRDPMPPQRVAGLLTLADALYFSHEKVCPSSEIMASLPPSLRLARTWENKEDLLAARKECPLSAILIASERAFFERKVILTKIWQLMAQEYDLSHYFEPELQIELWRALPASVLITRIEAGLVVEWEYLLPHQYSEVLDRPLSVNLPMEIMRHCPMDAALDALSTRGPRAFSPDALRLLFEREPTRVALLYRQFDDQPHEQSYLIRHCPSQASATLCKQLPAAHDLMKQSPQVVDDVRLFLRRAIVERHPEFEQCFSRLGEIERAMWPLRKVP